MLDRSRISRISRDGVETNICAKYEAQIAHLKSCIIRNLLLETNYLHRWSLFNEKNLRVFWNSRVSSAEEEVLRWIKNRDVTRWAVNPGLIFLNFQQTTGEKEEPEDWGLCPVETTKDEGSKNINTNHLVKDIVEKLGSQWKWKDTTY